MTTEMMMEWGFLDQRVFRIAFVIIVLILVQYLSRWLVGRIIAKVINGHKYLTKREERQRADTLINMFSTTTVVILWIVAVIVILQEFGVNLGALATSAGFIGIVLGFGARGIVRDILSGIFIILENQYRIGDSVMIAGQSGTVEHITIRVTKLRDLEGNVYFIPNGEVTTVTNKTLGFSNVVIEVGVSYATDINKAEKVMNEVGEALAVDPDWKGRITAPIKFLRLDTFGETNITLKALGKVTPAEQWAVAGEYRRRIKAAFDKNKIEMIASPAVADPATAPVKKPTL